MSDSVFAPAAALPSVRIQQIPRVHLIGIAGAGMRSLADVLEAAGWETSGSDIDAGALAGVRHKAQPCHDPDHVDATFDLVVHSDAVPSDNVELAQARALGVPICNYPQMLGRLMESRIGVAVAGTHGKSTATAMAGEILVSAGLDPTVIFGATPIVGDSGGRFGRGRLFVAEACEFRGNFLHLKPHLAVLLGIEPDHFDCFSSPDELLAAFARFAAQVPDEGLVLARAECPVTARAIHGLGCASESFGLAATATWQATKLRERHGFYSFEVRARGRLVTDVKLHVPGRHNVFNALAAAALASHCGATGTAIRAGLDRFAGLRRRLQLLGEVRGIAILDDYAHHPTEVTAALATVRQMYPDRRVWCVFQPHQATRTGHLLDEFADSLHNAEKIVVAEIFRARETPARAGEITAADLASRLAARGADAAQLKTAGEILEHLRPSLRPGDVVITMGAGDIGKIAHELGQGLRTFRQAG